MKKLATVKELLEWAQKHNRAVCAFNVNSMEFVQAVTEAADELGVPVILQMTKNAINYAGVPYIIKLVEAAVQSVNIPIALHLDHGHSFEQCKEVLDSGFTSVMIDGSHLSFEDNIALTKKVVDYAKKTGASVEGELGQIAGIEDDTKAESSLYTDPKTVKEFVTKTGVTSLAISIGTAHGAHKYKSEPNLRFDILAEIQKQIPNTPLVLHGASSVVQSDIETINKFGGKIEDALGVSEEILAKAIPLGVRKINIHSDLVIAFTAELRKYLAENPKHFDMRQYIAAARSHVKALVKMKLSHFSK